MPKRYARGIDPSLFPSPNQDHPILVDAQPEWRYYESDPFLGSQAVDPFRSSSGQAQPYSTPSHLQRHQISPHPSSFMAAIASQNPFDTTQPFSFPPTSNDSTRSATTFHGSANPYHTYDQSHAPQSLHPQSYATSDWTPTHRGRGSSRSSHGEFQHHPYSRPSSHSRHPGRSSSNQNPLRSRSDVERNSPPPPDDEVYPYSHHTRSLEKRQLTKRQALRYGQYYTM